jgi:hypothetical protein
MFDFPIETMLKTLSPKKGFALLSYYLKSIVKHEVPKYDLFFDPVNKKVYFTVYADHYEGGSKQYPFKKGEKFIDVAMNMITPKLPEGSSITAAMVKIDADIIDSYLFYVDKGEKKTIKHTF